MSRPTSTVDRRPTELECEATIIAAARTFGWLVHAERPARSGKGWRTPVKGHKGFPDLVLVRPPQLWIVELKRKPNKVETDQQAWLDALQACGVATFVVFVPEQLDEFCASLARRPVGGAL